MRLLPDPNFATHVIKTYYVVLEEILPKHSVSVLRLTERLYHELKGSEISAARRERLRLVESRAIRAAF